MPPAEAIVETMEVAEEAVEETAEDEETKGGGVGGGGILGPSKACPTASLQPTG